MAPLWMDILSFLCLTGGLHIKGQERMTLTDRVQVKSLCDHGLALRISISPWCLAAYKQKMETNGKRDIVDHLGVLIPFT